MTLHSDRPNSCLNGLLTMRQRVLSENTTQGIWLPLQRPRTTEMKAKILLTGATPVNLVYDIVLEALLTL